MKTKVKITPICETPEFPLRSTSLYKLLNTRVPIYWSHCLPTVYSNVIITSTKLKKKEEKEKQLGFLIEKKNWECSIIRG